MWLLGVFTLTSPTEMSGPRKSCWVPCSNRLWAGQKRYWEITKAYEDQRNLVGGQAPQLPDIMKMLQTATSNKRAFICINALDEWAAEHQVKLLNFPNQTLQKSPSTQIIVTGRPHIEDEIGKRLSRRMKTVRMTLR